MATERWSRMYQIPTAKEIVNNDNNLTSIRDLKDYLKKNEPEIEFNIVNSSVCHNRKLNMKN